MGIFLMGSCVIIYDNFSDAAVISGGSFLAALPRANMQDEDIQKVARTTDTANASTAFSIDFGSVRPIGGIVVGPTNISPGASWRARSYADAAMLTVQYDSGIRTVSGTTIDWGDTGAWLQWEDPGFWYGIPDSFDLTIVPTYLAEIVSVENVSFANAQYWTVEVFDSANPDGYLQFGRLLIGRAFRPSLNYTPDNSFAPVPLTDMVESLGGKRTFWDRGQRRTQHLAFDMLSFQELMGDVFRIGNRIGISRQIFLVPDPDDATNFNKRSYLGTFKAAPPIVQALADIGSTVIDVEEVL
jgi:hypothetical protein